MRLIFGIVYILIAIIFAFDFYLEISSLSVGVLLATYLILKGIISAVVKSSLFSTLDSVCGFYFLFLVLSVFPVNFVTVIFLIYLVQKGITNVFRGIY